MIKSKGTAWQFSEHVLQNYIEENSTFLPEIWVEISSALPKTTNKVGVFRNVTILPFYTHHSYPYL